LKRLARMGVLKEGSVIDDVLSLEVRVVLERRLQTMVLRKGLARTVAQSRQLITHGFIAINGKRVTRPGYLVPVDEESSLSHARPIDLSVKNVEEAPKTEAPKPETPKAAPAEKPPEPKQEAS
ncbi:MAG: 30S ribosomal protein S4, partial [Candidatus ainarchaeum sp.]|nr:30S ribosomal protein S4 [Candidatus ainarchaeum sp.]